jgi:dCTP deaminase
MILSKEQICAAVVCQKDFLARQKLLIELDASTSSAARYYPRRSQLQQDIRDLERQPRIHIDGFDPDKCGPNSYDLRLGKNLLMYTEAQLDTRKENPTTRISISETGFLLQPGHLYLGVTEEYTETYSVVPWLDGRSSTARLGLLIHQSAGRGDRSFCGRWTYELTVTIPLRVYAGTRIAQLSFFETGPGETTYANKLDTKYNCPSDEAWPLASQMYRDKY